MDRKKPKNFTFIAVIVSILAVFIAFKSSSNCSKKTKDLESRISALENSLKQKEIQLQKAIKEKEKAIKEKQRILAKLKEIEEKIKKANKALKRKGIRFTLPQGGVYITNPKDVHIYAKKLELNLDKILKIMKDIPVGVPLYGRITSKFGWRRDPFTGKRAFHTGLDFRASYKQPIFATANGKVIYAGWGKGYGKMVKIRHKYGYTTIYAHMFHIKVKTGQWVKAGQIIGYAGSTGRSTGVHLHYEIRKYGKLINPKKFLYLNNRNVF